MVDHDPNIMKTYPHSSRILQNNRRYIPGGAVSLNRVVQPDIVFARAKGSRLWDVDDNRYIDYHAAFAPHFLGHNDDDVNAAVAAALAQEASLYGAGTTEMEGELAALICDSVPFVDSVQVLNTGSEATYQGIRAARAITQRDHIVVMQGGYNGWHNDVACNLMTPLPAVGPRVSKGEYQFIPISAGIPKAHQQLVHPVNFNDLESVRWVCERYPIAALITEPILQNVGVIHPAPGYLQGLRDLADEFGFLLIFDEVKTGFRYGLAGYSVAAGVVPDLVIYGKAIANGYPIAAIGGKRQFMDVFAESDASRRVLLAGTYNGHPVPTAAAIATIKKLSQNDGEVYRHTDRLGKLMEDGLTEIVRRRGLTAVVSRERSAFCLYFMDHPPVDWHDLAANHTFAADEIMRRGLVERGIFVFPLATKQASISAAHSESDIADALEAWDQVIGSSALQEALCASQASGATARQ